MSAESWDDLDPDAPIIIQQAPDGRLILTIGPVDELDARRRAGEALR